PPLAGSAGPGAAPPRPRSRRRPGRCSRCRRRGCPTRSPLTPLRRNGLDLLRCEEEAMAGPALLAQVAARILLQGDREVDAVFIVLLDRLDEGHLAGQRDVHDVG